MSSEPMWLMTAYNEYRQSPLRSSMRCAINGVISSSAGNEMNVEIFLFTELECSKRFKWKLATMGSVRIDNCFVDSWYVLHDEHLIFALEPRCSARVKRSRQSINDVGGPHVPCTSPKSSDISQNGSMVVDTPWHDWHTTSDCKRPVKIWSIIQLHLVGLFVANPSRLSFSFSLVVCAFLQWWCSMSRVAMKNSCASCCS